MSAPGAVGSQRHDAEVIALIGLAHGTSHFFHLLLPPIFPWLMADYQLSFTQVGFLMTVFFVISGVGQALAGFVVDRVGARPVLFFGIGTLALSALALALASSYAGLIATAAIAGLGNSIFHPTDFTVLNRNVAAPRLGHAFSVHGLSGNLGWAAGSVTMAAVTAATHWQVAAVVALGLALGVLALLVWRRRLLAVHTCAADPGRPGAASIGPLAFLRSGAVWMCFAFFLITTAAFGVLQSYAPAILSNVYALALPLAAAGLTVYLLGSAVGTLAGGFVAARVHDADLSIAVALGVAALCALFLASGAASAWLVLPLMALLGAGVGVAGPNRDLLVRRAAMARFGQASYGRVYGFVYSGLDIGLAITPVFIGPLLDAGRHQVPLAVIAGLQVAALLLALLVGSGTRRSRAVHVQGAQP
jgi:MFS family permease